MEQLPTSQSLTKQNEKPESKYYVVPFRDLLVSHVGRIDVQLEISDAIASFLSDFLGQQNKNVCLVFSKTIIEEKPKWNLSTVNEFFSFVKRRRDIKEFRDVVSYGRQINVLMLMDWVVIFEDERRVIFEKTSVPSVSKSNPETVDRFVKEILGNIPRPAPPLPANRATQESDKKELNELIPLLNKEELKAMLKKLKEYSTIQKLEEKKVEVFYYSEQIELIKKHINDGKG